MGDVVYLRRPEPEPPRPIEEIEADVRAVLAEMDVWRVRVELAQLRARIAHLDAARRGPSFGAGFAVGLLAVAAGVAVIAL
jgi:hypothetical protein